MANDRMFLRNTVTGKRMLLAKHLAMGWYIPIDDLSDEIQQFFDENIDSFWENPRTYEIDYEHNHDCTKEKCTCDKKEHNNS